jgi:hypothetical protein
MEWLTVSQPKVSIDVWGTVHEIIFDANIYIAVYVTYCVTHHGEALIATYPNVKTLMCYFHVVNCCKKNLRSQPWATQKQICEYVYYLHSFWVQL